MRTIRNITFVVLCALVYLMPATAQASGNSCSANYLWTNIEEIDYYSANCGPGSCSNEAYNLAWNTCSWLVVEFFCDDETGMVTWGCYPPIMD